MQYRNRLLDDLARMAGGALSVLTGVRQEAAAVLDQRRDRRLSRLDMVRREEFEAVEAVAARAREEQERLIDRVAALEAALAARETGRAGRKPVGRGKSAGRKTSAGPA